MIAFALIVLAASLAIGFFATAAVVRMPSLRARTFGALLIVAALPLLAVVASGLVMFESTHDFVVLAIVSGSTAVALVAEPHQIRSRKPAEKGSSRRSPGGLANIGRGLGFAKPFPLRSSRNVSA